MAMVEEEGEEIGAMEAGDRATVGVVVVVDVATRRTRVAGGIAVIAGQEVEGVTTGNAEIQELQRTVVTAGRGLRWRVDI